MANISNGAAMLMYPTAKVVVHQAMLQQEKLGEHLQLKRVAYKPDSK